MKKRKRQIDAVAGKCGGKGAAAASELVRASAPAEVEIPEEDSMQGRRAGTSATPQRSPLNGSTSLTAGAQLSTLKAGAEVVNIHPSRSMQRSTLNAQLSTSKADEEACVPLAGTSALEASELGLSAQQQVALMVVISGGTRIAAASAAGVSRMTLYRWITRDPAFQLAYNSWIRDVLATVTTRLVALTHDSFTTVRKAIQGGDEGLAWDHLNKMGVVRPPGDLPQDLELIKHRIAIKEKVKEIDMRKEVDEVFAQDINTPGRKERWEPARKQYEQDREYRERVGRWEREEKRKGKKR